MLRLTLPLFCWWHHFTHWCLCLQIGGDLHKTGFLTTHWSFEVVDWGGFPLVIECPWFSLKNKGYPDSDNLSSRVNKPWRDGLKPNFDSSLHTSYTSVIHTEHRVKTGSGWSLQCFNCRVVTHSNISEAKRTSIPIVFYTKQYWGSQRVAQIFAWDHASLIH